MEKLLERIRRGAVHFVSEEELRRKLSASRCLRVKLGVDPTTSDLHLGHAVVLNKLRVFQELGHTAVLILGDFTARIGDPSGRSEVRPQLSPQEVRRHAQTYQEQAFRILDRGRTEVRFNSEWLEGFVREGLLESMRRTTLARLLEREDFSARMKSGEPLSLLELLYPVFQGYDSVAVRADVELGGQDQIFNLLFGRQIQKDCGQQPQVVLTLPLLLGTDGVRKMSKSYGNAVALNAPAPEMFGQLMSISDSAMGDYYQLLTEENWEALQNNHPKEVKLHLAQLLTSRYHSAQVAEGCKQEFERVFSKRELPGQLPEYVLPRGGASLVETVVASGMASSKNEARRLIRQGGVRWNGKVVRGEGVVLEEGGVLQVGRRNFRRLTFKSDES
ncbi:MAG: tyrosine--tRNA ligase [Elusimicrobia bacterium]|nr:tyrosine--tRNA ligase [Elusimicrobiota bacterium]